MSRQDNITDTEFSEKAIRSLDAVCVNESELQHKWYHNLKYLIVGILFGIILSPKRLLGLGYMKCSTSNLSICMVLLAVR